jgi:hypothetical protein
MKVPLFRLAALGTLVAFIAACTRHIPVNPDVAIAEQRIEGLVAIHLEDQRVLVSDWVTVSDSTFVVSSLREDGQMKPVAPIVIPRGEVASIERLEKHYRPLVLAGAGALLVLLLFFVWSDEPGWGDI